MATTKVVVWNLNSEASCRDAYVRYKLNPQSSGITQSDINEMTDKWSTYVKSWDNAVINAKNSKDKNEYDIDLSGYKGGIKKKKTETDENGKKKEVDVVYDRTSVNSKIESGKEKGATKAARRAGTDGSTGGNTTTAVFSDIGGLGSSTFTVIGMRQAGGLKNFGSTKIFSSGNAPKNVVGNAQKSSANSSAIVATCIGIATAGLYYATRGSKKEAVDAVNKFREMYAEYRQDMETANANMEGAEEKSQEFEEEAIKANEETQETIDKETNTIQLASDHIDRINERVASGKMTEQQAKKAILFDTGLIENSKSVIADVIPDNQKTLDDVEGAMVKNSEDILTGTGEQIGLSQALGQCAEDIDGATQTNCYMEMVGQGLNAASTAVSSSRLLSMGPWFWALGGTGLLASAASGKAAVEQGQWAGQVGDEIEDRKMFQETDIADLQESLDEHTDAYIAHQTSLEDLTINEPDLERIANASTQKLAMNNNGNNNDNNTVNSFGVKVESDKDSTSNQNNEDDNKKPKVV